MGIKDLLPRLKAITREIKVGQELLGAKAAVDASCILHRRASLQPREHVLDCEDSNLIPSCMEQVRYLRKHGIEPIIVFDGDQLPLKAAEEDERNRGREASFLDAVKLEAMGDVVKAEKAWRKAAAIKPYHVKRFIEALKAEPSPVEFIVAPYEADAQMAYLELTGRVQAVITDDSDLLAYGCKRVLFKMDFFAGTASEVRIEDLHKNDAPKFHDWDHDLFQELCVLSGCDFLDNIHRRAIMTVYKGLNEHRSGLEYIQMARADPKAVVPPDYELGFLRARATFRHQTVFCPDRKVCVPLTPLPSEGLGILQAYTYSAGTMEAAAFMQPRNSSGASSTGNKGSGSSIGSGGGGDFGDGGGGGSSSSSSSSSSSGSGSGSGSISVMGVSSWGLRSMGVQGMDAGSLDFLGPPVPPEVAAAIARGDLDARTKQPFPSSVLASSFCPTRAEAMGLKDAQELRRLHALAQSVVSLTGSSSSGSSSSRLTGRQGRRGSSSDSREGGRRELSTAAVRLEGQREGQRGDVQPSAPFWEAAIGDASLPAFGTRRLAHRPGLKARLTAERLTSSRGLSPQPALPESPAFLHHRAFTNGSSHLVTSSSRSSSGSGGMASAGSRLCVRPLSAIQGFARNAPLLLRRVLA